MFIWIRWLAEVTWACVALAEPCCPASCAWRFLGQRLDRVKKEVGEPLNLVVDCKRGWLGCLQRGLTFGQRGWRRCVAADIWTTTPNSTFPHKLQITYRFQHFFDSEWGCTCTLCLFSWHMEEKKTDILVTKIRISFYDLLTCGYILFSFPPHFS